MSLSSLHRQLTEVARRRAHSGELTERGLARLCGVSQPHMHNVLKGIRALSTASADRLLEALDLSVPELVWQCSTDSVTEVQPVPVLRNRIGPGTEAVFTRFDGHVPFPTNLTRGLVSPVAARVGPDLVLPRCIATDDLALLDQNPERRANPNGGGCWVVADDAGLRIRYIREEGGRMYSANESNVEDPRLWRPLPRRSADILDAVRARVVWIGRDMIAPRSGSG